MDDDVDDRYAGIDIDSLLSRNDTRRGLTYGRKKALYEAPEFLQRLNGEETIMEGQALCLECKVQGFPVPTLRWYKDDEEIVDHPRIKVQSDGKGGYALLIDNVMRGDEAAYRCRAENVEGACSSVFFLSVRAKPKSARKDNQKSPNRRTVSFPPMFSTIVEKVEEEEKQGRELEMLPPSPLTDSYYALTLKSRATWPAFLGDWAFKNGNRRGSDDDAIPNGDAHGPQSPSEGRENARKALKRSDLTARVQAKKQRLDEEKKQREEEAEQRKRDKEETEEERKKREAEEREKEEVRRRLEEKKEEERKLETKLILEREERRRKRAELERESAEKEEAMRKRREARAQRIERERKEREEEEERWRKQQEEEDTQRRLRAQKRQEEEEQERAEEESREREKVQREEARRKGQEGKRKEEERAKREDEERKKCLEEKRKEEEKTKKEEEERKKHLEEKRKEEEKQKKEEDERKRTLEEKRKKEDEARKKHIEEKKREEEKKRKDDEERRKHLEEKRIEEEKLRLAELKRKEEEKKRKEEEDRKRKNLNSTAKHPENGMDEKLQSLFGKNKTLNDHQKSLTDKRDTNTLKSKSKAFQLFQHNTEDKSGQATLTRPKPGVLGRFQEKVESQLANSTTKAAEEAMGKPGKFKLPGISAHDKMAALQSKIERDSSSSSTLPPQSQHIPEKAALKKLGPWHRTDGEKAGSETRTNNTNVPDWKKDLKTKKSEEKIAEESKFKENSVHKLEEKKGETQLKEEARKIEEVRLKDEKRRLEEKKRIEANLEETKRKEHEKRLLEQKKEEERRLKEAKQKEELKKKEEEKSREEKRKLEEKRGAEEKLKENKKRMEEEHKQLDLKRKQEAEEKKKKDEKERQLIKADLARKQAAQREALEKKKQEEEAKKRAQREKEEQEKIRLQFRKEQLRKEQLKRQRDEEILRKQRKEKEDERNKEKDKENKVNDLPEDDSQVKVYKRDYSFSDLRKSLEATLTRAGAPVLDPQEHKYWDDILEKHNYSVGDIKKTLDTLSSGSATLERPPRLRSRRNSIEDLELVKMKRSSSISDLRESYTKSLERPNSKKKATDPEKVKRDGEILKRSAKLQDTRQQLLDTVKKQLEPLVGGQSTREADITIRNLKVKTAETPTARSPVGPMPATSPFLPQGSGSNPAAALGLANLSVNVKSKRASFHELMSQQPGDVTPSLRLASFASRDTSKRKSYHGHDAYGSREIPVYRRAAGWMDEIGKSRDVSPQPPGSASSSRGKGAVVPSAASPFPSAAASETKPASAASRPGKLTLPDRLAPDVRPFVFNSTRTIARRFKADS